jgi:hypothetical protein
VVAVARAVVVGSVVDVVVVRVRGAATSDGSGGAAARVCEHALIRRSPANTSARRRRDATGQ